MFHALNSETKQQNDSTRTQSPRADFSAPVPVAPGSVPLRDQLARLHSTYGNQAVLRMLSQSAPAIQTKLAVNKPGDEFEQEADRVADQVMRMSAPAPSIQRKCSGCEEEEKVQRKCAGCEEEEKQTGLQRKETGADPQFAPPVVHDVLRSSGQPLDRETRAFMEPRFGHDFSAVRVHTDAGAADSARAVNALAYTAGQHVVFGSNRYSPGTHQGQRLLAHELAHVVQSKPHLARDKAEQPAPAPNPVPNPPTNQPPSTTAPAANPPATCTVPADAAKQIADQGIPAKVIASMKYAIGMGTIRAGKAIALTDAIINQADAAIKAQFGSLLPSRSFSKGGSITKQTPDQIANARVPDAETARRIIRQVALRTSEDALKALCITDEDNSVLDSAVAVPVLATLTIDGVRNYEKSEIGGLTSFPTQAGALPKVALPTESPNIGHIVVHEAMHFYVHDVYRNTAEAGQFRREMMEGGAEFMARLVIMNQIPSDPNFVINYSTYSNEVNFIYKNYTMGGNFPLAYLQGRVDVLGLKPVQPKMEIDQSGDPLEREADQMADQVMRMKAPPHHHAQHLNPRALGTSARAIQRQCSSCAEEERVQRKCAECEEEEKKTGLQRKQSGVGSGFAPPSVQPVLNSSGRGLDPATRAFMESRFGRDFSDVRLHTDANAAESARDVNALAYTSGEHVVFASNQYSPGTPEGQRLLAHELTHVLQQSETIRRVCDPVALGARTAPVFFPKQAKLMDVFTGGSTLKKGSADKEAVGLVQQALTDICFDEGIWGPNKDGVDRKFGDDTENGVKVFQGSQTITDSGEVDKETLRCLDEVRLKRIEPCKSAPMTEADLLIKEQRTGGADEDIFFGRGDKTLDADDKTKLAKIAKNQKDTSITLTGFESEDELADFGDKLAGERVDAVSAELGKDGQGDEAKYRKKDPQPQASAGKLDYRRSRRVHIVLPGAPAPPDCTKIPPGWTHPDFGPCDAATEKLVQDAIDLGVKFMGDAIKALKPGDKTAEDAVAARFGDKKHLPEVKGKLDTWKDHLDKFVRAHHECTNECHSACVGTGAYTSNKDTFLCPKVMQKPANKDDENEQALIILHEAGHGALSTKDVAYDATRMLSLIQKDYSLAKINTDSYVLLIQCLNGITIRGMGCTVPKPGDKFTGTNAGEQTIAEEALAWLERWMDFVWQDVNNLYPAVVRARTAGKWAADDSGEQSTMDLLSRHFGLHRPEGSPAPTMREETEVAAIHERYFRMNRLTEKSVAREFIKDDAATPEWKDSPAKVVVNNAFFSKAPRARVRFLVELLVKAQPDISAAAEPAYVAFADADAKTWFDKP